MKSTLSAISACIFSSTLLAQGLIQDGELSQQTSEITQYHSQSQPWQLVDYLDNFTAIAGHYDPQSRQFSREQDYGTVMFIQNGAVRQHISQGLVEDEDYFLSLELGQKLHSNFPNYRIGLQAGEHFVELASLDTHGSPAKGEFRTIEVGFRLGTEHSLFTSGNEDVYLLIEAVSENGSTQLNVDNVSLTQGYQAGNSLLDSDSDGMPDEWELKMGLDLNLAADAQSDSDGDGSINLQEYRDNTDPMDATDQLNPLSGIQSKRITYANRSQVQALARLPIEISGIRLIPMATAPVSCNADSEGAQYYDSVNKLTLVCNGSDWQAIQGNDLVDDADADPANELQTLAKSGNTVTLSQGGGSFVDAVDDADADASNEIQTLAKSGNTVTLSQGGGSFVDAVDDADADASNEIQTLSKTDNTITLSQNGGSFIDAVDDADADATNELQQLTQVGSTISLSQNGGSVSISDGDADSSNEIQTLTKTGSLVSLSRSGGSFTDAVNDADANPVNELQTLSLTGNQLSLSQGGGSVTLSDEVNDADADSSNELVTAVAFNSTNQQLTVSEGQNSQSADLSSLATKAYVNTQLQAASGGLKFMAFGRREQSVGYCVVTADKGGYMHGGSSFCSCKKDSHLINLSGSANSGAFACVKP